GSICCIRCINCSASAFVSNIMRLYNCPALTWSHLHIVSVIVFPPGNRLSSRFSSQTTSAYRSSPLVLLLLTSTPFLVIRRAPRVNDFPYVPVKQGAYLDRNAPLPTSQQQPLRA